MRITRNDPSRERAHDYIVQDENLRDVAAFDTVHEALLYAQRERQGKVSLVQVVHPDGCDCTDVVPVTMPGRAN